MYKNQTKTIKVMPMIVTKATIDNRDATTGLAATTLAGLSRAMTGNPLTSIIVGILSL